MTLLTSSRLRGPRRRRLRVAVTAGVLLLFALGAAGPAWASGAKSPHRIILDPAAEPSWAFVFSSPDATPDAAQDVAMTKGGVTYVAGTMSNTGGSGDASLVKLVDGVPAWPAPKRYDSAHHNTDSATEIAVGRGDVVYTAGPSARSDCTYDILVVKWSSSGVVKWARRYDGPSHSDDTATALAVDSAGNVVVAGTSAGPTGVDWVVVSWSSSGARRWTSRSGSTGPGHVLRPHGLVVAADRSVYASGVAAVGPVPEAMTVRYSPAGKKMWTRKYKGPDGLGARLWAAHARPGGGVYVCGNADSHVTGRDGLVMSYTAKGARKAFTLDTGPGGPSDQGFADLAVTSTKQVVAVGSSAAGGNEDCRAVTYSAAGTIVAQVTLPGPWQDEFVAAASDAFGGFYATGPYHTAAGKTAILTVRGSVLTGGGGFLGLWAPVFVSQGNYPHAIAVRGSTVCVVGECVEGAHGSDQFVLGFVY